MTTGKWCVKLLINWATIVGTERRAEKIKVKCCGLELLWHEDIDVTYLLLSDTNMLWSRQTLVVVKIIKVQNVPQFTQQPGIMSQQQSSNGARSRGTLHHWQSIFPSISEWIDVSSLTFQAFCPLYSIYFVHANLLHGSLLRLHSKRSLLMSHWCVLSDFLFGPPEGVKWPCWDAVESCRATIGLGIWVVSQNARPE